MAQMTITNVTSSDVLIQDLYVSVPAGESITVTRSPEQLPLMASLIAALADKSVTLSVEYSADEIAAGVNTGPSAPIVVDEFTNPPAADPNGIKLIVECVEEAVTYSGDELDGVVGTATMSPARNVTVTTSGSTPLDAPATATFVGLDQDGNEQTEAITVAQTATTAVGAKAFASVSSITLTAADGTDCSLEFGFGALMGLSKPIRTRAGRLAVIQQVVAGTVVTTGTFAAPSVGTPNGTYSPATPADASTDYALTYEEDPALPA